MQEVFLCHAPQDATTARQIAAHLERWGDVQVLLEPCEAIPQTWHGGLRSDAILLLLSPNCVPASPRLDDWAQLLDHLEGNGAPPLASVLLRPCAIPARLKRKRHHGEIRLRDLERWVMSLHTPPPIAPPPPDQPEARSEHLWTDLVDNAGFAAADSRQARQFASEAGEHFREVLWIDCVRRPRSLLLGELAWRLGLDGSGTLEQVARRVEEAIGARRLLLVFDGLTGDLPLTPPEGCRTSILTTSEATPSASVDETARTESELLQALHTDWTGAVKIARRVCPKLRNDGRRQEAAYLYERVREESARVGDAETEAWCAGELSWLLDGDRIAPAKLDGSQLSLDLA